MSTLSFLLFLTDVGSGSDPTVEQRSLGDPSAVGGSEEEPTGSSLAETSSTVNEIEASTTGDGEATGNTTEGENVEGTAESQSNAGGAHPQSKLMLGVAHFRFKNLSFIFGFQRLTYIYIYFLGGMQKVLLIQRVQLKMEVL